MLPLLIVGTTLGMFGLLMYSVQRSRPAIDAPDGTATFAYHLLWQGFALLVTFVPPLAIMALVTASPPKHEPENLIPLVVCAFFIAVGGSLAWEFVLYELIATEQGLDCRSPWRGRRLLRWDEVQSVRYEELAMWFTIRGRDGYTFHLPILASGVPVFLEHCEAHLPIEALTAARSGYQRVRRPFPSTPGASSRAEAPVAPAGVHWRAEVPATPAGALDDWRALPPALLGSAPIGPPLAGTASTQPRKSNQKSLLLMTFVGGFLALLVWSWCLTTPTTDVREYTTVTGTLKSFEEVRFGRRNFNLDFYIEESPTRFRVQSATYQNTFDGKAFFANARPGHRITFQVEKAELAKPYQAMGDPKPTVDVYAMSDHITTYATLEGRQAWQQTNRTYGVGIAIFLTGATLFAGWLYAKQGKRLGQATV